MKNIRTVFTLFTTLLVLCISPVANAHKVNLFAYAEEGEVYVEGYFVDGKKAQNSIVQVFNAAGDMINEGTTDGEGVYRFPISEKSDLKITVNAGMGHKGEFMLAADELGSEPKAVKQTRSHSHGADSDHQHDDQPQADAHSHDVVADDSTSTDSAMQSSSTYSDADLQKAVRQAVNEAIKPLVRELEESQQKASLSGIVGGVGYILGFLGLFAFMKARQQVEKGEKA